MKLSTIQRKKFRVRGKVKKVSKNDRFRLSIARSSKNIRTFGCWLQSEFKRKKIKYAVRI